MKCTRFAPSPTGLLHLGNIYSALQCESWAKEESAKLLLRIENIDFTRCREDFSQKIIEDLSWLNISFDGDIIYQQQRLTLYKEALDKLIVMGVLYPCFCTRKQIEEAHLIMRAVPENGLMDNYPETCKKLSVAQQDKKIRNKPFSWRLDMKAVEDILGKQLFWLDIVGNQHDFLLSQVGDVVIGRKDIQYSYHLAVVVDDSEQAVTHVIRGEDLYASTPVHIIIQRLLGYTSPRYQHHKLIADEKGSKLAKRKQSVALKSLRDAGVSAKDVRQQLEACQIQDLVNLL